MKFRNRFDGVVHKGISFPLEEGRTKGSFADECDINSIMARHLRTGQLPDLIKKNGSFGDFSQVPDYQDALNLVLKAQTTFDALPAAVRADCFNDPSVFLDKVHNDPQWTIKHKLALPRELLPVSPSVGVQEPPVGGAATQPGGVSSSSSGVKPSGSNK